MDRGLGKAELETGPMPENKLTVLLSPTRRCNLRCRYCYVEQRGQEDMNLDDFRAFYSWLPGYCRHIGASRLELSWFGGEPLAYGQARWEQALEMQEEFLAPCGIPWVNRMQSNLLLATEQTCRLLQKHFDSAIGGSFEPQGSQRIYPDGRTSATDVERKIAFLRENGIRVGIVSTLTKTDLLPPSEFYAWFKNRVDAVRVNRAHPPRKDDVSADDYLNLREYGDYVLELSRLYVADEHPGFDFTNFTSIMRAMFLHHPLECVSIQEPHWKIAVSGPGVLSSCCRCKEIVLGNVHDSSPADVVATYRQHSRPLVLSERCRECEFRPSGLCDGGCFGEPDCDCMESECGYRTEYTRETLAFVKDFLAANHIGTLEEGMHFHSILQSRRK